MSEISSLSLKIPQELKEMVKAAALENGVSISAEVTTRLLKSFEQTPRTANASEKAVDSQHTQEVAEEPLTQKEIKKIRQLIKDKVKGSTKKK